MEIGGEDIEEDEAADGHEYDDDVAGGSPCHCYRGLRMKVEIEKDGMGWLEKSMDYCLSEGKALIRKEG